MRCVRGALGPLRLGVTAMIVAWGCSESPPQAAALPGAVYGTQLPIYPGAKYEDAMGGTWYGEGGRPVSESLSWFFTVSDPPEDVLAFYEAKLPGAERGVIDENDPTFTVVPAGAEEGEYVRVVVRPGKLQITEVVKAGKRKS
jgi:hypothetical protein